MVRNVPNKIIASFTTATALFLAAPAWAGGQPPAQAAAQPMTAAQIMIKADKNHDGRISPDEAAKVADLANRFETVDADHDGFLSAGELYAANHAAAKAERSQ